VVSVEPGTAGAHFIWNPTWIAEHTFNNIAQVNLSEEDIAAINTDVHNYITTKYKIECTVNIKSIKFVYMYKDVKCSPSDASIKILGIPGN